MEKFGEWKVVYSAAEWMPDGKAVWEIDVLKPGDYDTSLTYTGEGRLVWKVGIEGGGQVQNQQNASHNHQQFPIGRLNFPAPGKYKVAVSCMEGNIGKTKRAAVFTVLLVLCAAFRVGAEERPNIIFIFADDWGYGDLGIHGSTFCKISGATLGAPAFCFDEASHQFSDA